MSDDEVPGPGTAGLRRELARLEAVRRWGLRLGPPLFIGLAVLAAVTNRQGPPPGLSGRSLAVSAALTGLTAGCLGVQRAARRPGSAYLACSAVVIVSSAVLLWAQPSGPGYACTFVGVLLVALRLPWRAALGLPAAAIVALAVTAQLAGVSAVGQLAVMAAFGGFFGMMYLADRLGGATRGEECLRIELEHRRAAAAQAAGLAERQRLAREMHDVLAHSLSGLMLQLETRPGGPSARSAAARCPAPSAWRHWRASSGTTGASPATWRSPAANACSARRPAWLCTGSRRRR